VTVSDEILYFPSIEFASPDWVKGSLLLWDKIYRIVPKEYTPDDSAEIRMAIDSGLIRNITLEKEDLAQTHDDFLQFVDNLPFMPAGLQEYPNTEPVHKDKIDTRLYPILKKIVNRFEGDDWFYMPTELSKGYMFFLADIVAGRRNMYKGTDNPDAWVTSYYFSEGGNFSEYVYDGEAEGQLAYLNFKDLIPITVPRVPMKSIIRFVEERRDEKKAFREHANAFIEKLAQCESKSHVENLLADYKQDLIKAKDNLRRSMSFCSVDDLSAILTVALPVAMSVLGCLSIYVDRPEFTPIFASLGIGSVAALLELRKAQREQRSAHHASYLLNLEERLAREGKIYKFNNLMEQFIND
jgi:hypothetical protein